jgi:hypothetical protein
VSVLDAFILDAVVVGAQWKIIFASVALSGVVGRLLKGMVFSLRRYPIKIQQSYFTIPSIILRWL